MRSRSEQEAIAWEWSELQRRSFPFFFFLFHFFLFFFNGMIDKAEWNLLGCLTVGPSRLPESQAKKENIYIYSFFEPELVALLLIVVLISPEIKIDPHSTSWRAPYTQWLTLMIHSIISTISFLSNYHFFFLNNCTLSRFRSNVLLIIIWRVAHHRWYALLANLISCNHVCKSICTSLYVQAYIWTLPNIPVAGSSRVICLQAHLLRVYTYYTRAPARTPLSPNTNVTCI